MAKGSAAYTTKLGVSNTRKLKISVEFKADVFSRIDIMAAEANVSFSEMVRRLTAMGIRAHEENQISLGASSH